MKNIILICFVIIYCSCTNDVTSIGHDLIYDEDFVAVERFPITQTSTVKLDSFATSSGSYTLLKNLMVGSAKDPFTGRTTVTPYFEIVPYGGTEIKNTYGYDSITFNFSYSGSIWGDTTAIQTYYVHQLKENPLPDAETDLLYNISTVPYHPEVLGTFDLLPSKRNLQKLYFRLDDNLGRTLFDMVKYNTEEIRNDALFINYFKGLTLIPDKNNSCVFTMSALPDSLNVRLHFHDSDKNYTYMFAKSTEFNRYTFMHITNDAVGTPYSVLTNQMQNLSFQDAAWGNAASGQTLTQGLTGFMIKMELPIAPAGEKYRTIVKAEIELQPEQYANLEFSLPSIINLYQSDSENKVITPILDAAGNAVSGVLYYNINTPEKNKYVINITDYYNNLCLTPNALENNKVIVSVPVNGMGTSYNRLTVDRIPVLKVYYAKYE